MWFTTFCSGFLKGSLASKSATAVLLKPGTAATQKELVAAYKATGAAFTDTATALMKLPAPTLAGGQNVATVLPTALKKVAVIVNDLATKTAAVNVAKDPTGMLALAQSTQATLQSGALAAVGPITELDARVQADLLKIPACSKMQAAITGG